MQFSKAICSVKSINSPGSLALVQGLGESGETAETDRSHNHQQLQQHQTQEPLIASGQMAVKVYVCINDLSLGENQKNFSQHLSILEASLNDILKLRNILKRNCHKFSFKPPKCHGRA